MSETKSTSPEIIFDITENNQYIFAIKCFWRNELCVIYSAYFTIVTKWIGFLEASKQESFFWTAWPLSQHWRCQIFFKCNIQLNCLSVQHPSEEFNLFLFVCFCLKKGLQFYIQCKVSLIVKEIWQELPSLTFPNNISLASNRNI